MFVSVVGRGVGILNPMSLTTRWRRPYRSPARSPVAASLSLGECTGPIKKEYWYIPVASHRPHPRRRSRSVNSSPQCSSYRHPSSPRPPRRPPLPLSACRLQHRTNVRATWPWLHRETRYPRPHRKISVPLPTLTMMIWEKQAFRCPHLGAVLTVWARTAMGRPYTRHFCLSFRRWYQGPHCQWLEVGTLKFIYSKKDTKSCKIFTLVLTTVHTVKSKVEILWPSQNIWTL